MYYIIIINININLTSRPPTIIIIIIPVTEKQCNRIGQKSRMIIIIYKSVLNSCMQSVVQIYYYCWGNVLYNTQ